MFVEKRVIKIFSSELLDALVADDEAPWATWNRGKPMSPRQLSGKLSEFGIKSKQIRINVDSKKGYQIEDFKDAFTRYLSATPPSQSETSKQASNDVASSVSQGIYPTPAKTPCETLQPSNYAGCFDVSDRTPPFTEDRGNKSQKDAVSHEERL